MMIPRENLGQWKFGEGKGVPAIALFFASRYGSFDANQFLPIVD